MAVANRVVALSVLVAALLVATGSESDAAAVGAPDADFVALTSGIGSSSASLADNESSASKRKVSRQINFDDDVSGERSTERSFSPFASSGSRGEKDKPKKTEEFDGFPDGFVTGLKPFNFEETAGTHRDSKSTGFFKFPEKDNLPSFATTLGGLTRFPPLASASLSSSASSDSDGRSAPSGSSGSRTRNEFALDDNSVPHYPPSGRHREITPDSFREEPPRDDNDAGFPSGSSKPGGNDDSGDYFPSYRGDESAENDQRGRSYLDRRPERKLNDGFGDESRRSSGKRPATSAEADTGFAGFTDYESPSSFRSSFPAEEKSGSLASELSYSRNNDNGLTSDDERQEVQGTSNVAVTAAPPTSTDSAKDSPMSNFRDSNRFEARDSQNFVPIGHFQNGRFAFHDFGANQGADGGFRPLVGNNGHRPAVHEEPASHAVRNFRQTSRPHFFITNEGNGANFDGNFFGGGGDFAPQRHHQPSSSAEGFQQPQFNFEPQSSHRPHQQFHGDDVTNHHSSATNLLGSGNFNIIRGGIFADDENPPSSSSFHSFRPVGHHQQEDDGPKDFFHGFRDFQPFGGSLNNALSLNSQNIQKAPSNQKAVTARGSDITSANTAISNTKMMASA